MKKESQSDSLTGWRLRAHEIIFEADTPSGKTFDILLIVTILASVLVVLLESVSSIRDSHGTMLVSLEWAFTILFTVEYFLRLMTVSRPMKYATSFYGFVDLASVLPTYLNFLLPGSHYLFVFRILRVLRVFRVLKLVKYLGEVELLSMALKKSARKIVVFVFFVVTLSVIFGSFIYLIEGEENGFTSIPKSIYWAIVTMTTVGYGDISPDTPLGQAFASFIMILGYGIIAVPTGIMTVEMGKAFRGHGSSSQHCSACSKEGHDEGAKFCKHCGESLHVEGLS